MNKNTKINFSDVEVCLTAEQVFDVLTVREIVDYIGSDGFLDEIGVEEAKTYFNLPLTPLDALEELDSNVILDYLGRDVILQYLKDRD